jgi:hypothetical protein
MMGIEIIYSSGKDVGKRKHVEPWGMDEIDDEET